MNKWVDGFKVIVWMSSSVCQN